MDSLEKLRIDIETCLAATKARHKRVKLGTEALKFSVSFSFIIYRKLHSLSVCFPSFRNILIRFKFTLSDGMQMHKHVARTLKSMQIISSGKMKKVLTFCSGVSPAQLCLINCFKRCWPMWHILTPLPSLKGIRSTTTNVKILFLSI